MSALKLKQSYIKEQEEATILSKKKSESNSFLIMAGVTLLLMFMFGYVRYLCAAGIGFLMAFFTGINPVPNYVSEIITISNLITLGIIIYLWIYGYKRIFKKTVKKEEILPTEQDKQQPILKVREVPGVLSEQEKHDGEVKRKRKWWLPLPFISFAIFYTFRNTKIDDTHLFISLFYFLSLVLAPLFYSWIRPKIKIIKYEKLESFIIGLVIYLFFCFAIGFLGSLGDAIILKTPLASSDSKENNNTISPEWSQYTSEEDNFSVLFPSQPSIEKQDSNFPEDPEVIYVKSYKSSIAKESTYYRVNVLQYNSNLYDDKSFDAASNLEASLNQLVNGVKNGKIIYSNSSEFLGHNALEFKISDTNGGNYYIKGIIFFAGNYFYYLNVVYSTESESQVEYDKFINSFRLIENSQILNTPSTEIKLIDPNPTIPLEDMRDSPTQEGCAVAVDEYMKNYDQGKEKSVGQWYDSSDYKYHFDPVQNKCFILISTYYTPSTTFKTKFTLNLYDLYNYTEIGTYQEYDNGNIFCNIATQDCANRKEYESLVAQYME